MRAGIVAAFLVAFIATLFVGHYLELPSDKAVSARISLAWRKTRAAPRALGNVLLESIVAPFAQRDVSPGGVPRLDLSVAPQHLRKIEDDRTNALFYGVLLDEQKTSVPAVLQVDHGHPHGVTIRLKGDWTDHLQGDKWSFRVELRDAALFGMRRFSLQRNEARGGHGEYLFLQHLRSEGVLSPRYFYVDLWLNQRHVGLMALEEHFAKELLESQRRRESVILAFDEQPLWRQRCLNKVRARHGVGGDEHGYFDELGALPMRVFESNHAWKTAGLRNHLEQAMGLLHAYEQGAVASEDVFEMRIMGRYLALANIWGAFHGLIDHNLRWYYNPITRLCEPIGFDNNICARDLNEPANFQSILSVRPLTSKRFRTAYFEALRELERQFADGGLLQELRRQEDEVLAILRTENPELEALPLEMLAVRCRALLAMDLADELPVVIDHWRPPIREPGSDLAMNSYIFWRGNDRGSYLEIQNVTRDELVVASVALVKGSRRMYLDLPAAGWRIPPAGSASERVRIPVPASPLDRGDYVVTVRSVTTDEVFEIEARRDAEALTSMKYRSGDVDALLAQFSFLRRDGASLLIPAGTWHVGQDMVLPLGMPLKIEAGTSITCGHGVRIVAHGALTAVGSKEAPIRLHAKDPAQPWSGLVVLQAQQMSQLTEVEIAGTGHRPVDDWGLTGGVTFYESDVALVRCMIHDTVCEDALNIVRSELRIEACSFSKTRSDAVDVDFGSGRIVDTEFHTIGGDGLDVSGTELAIENLRLHDIEDKAVSIGERSRVSGSGVTIRTCSIGIVAKDDSRGELRDVEIENVAVGLMTYVKKLEYGSPQLRVDRMQLEKCGRQVIAQIGSQIHIDGVIQATEELDVERLYAGAQK